jgi:hypothetical protein
MAGGHGMYRILGRNIGSQYVPLSTLPTSSAQLTRVAGLDNLDSHVWWSVLGYPEKGGKDVEGGTQDCDFYIGS